MSYVLCWRFAMLTFRRHSAYSPGLVVKRLFGLEAYGDVDGAQACRSWEDMVVGNHIPNETHAKIAQLNSPQTRMLTIHKGVIIGAAH